VTRRVIDSLDGPVVLVGHSYGGAVITEAGTHEKRELRQERKIPYP
jgi:pimeloyl-ACP methyl ester carboxylesterase